MNFHIEELSPQKLQGDWRDLYRIPLDMFKAFFWLTPKAIIAELQGKAMHVHEHEEPIDDSPGWLPAGEGWPQGLERKYFEAEKVFDDSTWHAVDGYTFKWKLSFPAMESMHFEGKSLLPLASGFIGQIIRKDGDNKNCPLVFVDLEKHRIETILEMEDLAHIIFEKDCFIVERPSMRWKVSYQL